MLPTVFIYQYMNVLMLLHDQKFAYVYSLLGVEIWSNQTSRYIHYYCHMCMIRLGEVIKDLINSCKKTKSLKKFDDFGERT